MDRLVATATAILLGQAAPSAVTTRARRLSAGTTPGAGDSSLTSGRASSMISARAANHIERLYDRAMNIAAPARLVDVISDADPQHLCVLVGAAASAAQPSDLPLAVPWKRLLLRAIAARADADLGEDDLHRLAVPPTEVVNG